MLVVTTIAVITCTAVCRAEPVIDRQRCIECHSQPEMALAPMRFDDGDAVPIYVNRDRFESSVHGHMACDQCHREYHPAFQQEFTPQVERKPWFASRRAYGEEMQAACTGCHMDQEGACETKIGSVLHPSDGTATPLCADCHSPHSVQATVDARQLYLECAKCHESIVRTFRASIHGNALDQPGNFDAPTCTTCHFAHQDGGKSIAAQRMRQGRPCMGCHGDAQLMSKYGISVNVVSTYFDDFHGVSNTLSAAGAVPAGRDLLICSDCHGYHSVMSVEGSESLALMQQRLEQSCLKCHPQATASFSAAWLSHREPSLTDHTLVFLVKAGYTVLIPFVITGLCIHILFDLVVLPLRVRHQARAAGAEQRGHSQHDSPDPDAPAVFTRFTGIQRLEHLIVLTTFVLLLITGLPQRFHDTSWAEQVVRLFGSLDQLRFVHRFAGVVLTIASAAHIARVVVGVAVRRMPMSMVPTRQDFEDTLTMVKYFLGRADQPPRSDRFSYGEKFEYWGMVLGSIVMIASGILLLYPMWWSGWVPGQFFTVARTAHSYEAMMALLTIIVWHMYGARFDPCIFTGRISAKKLAHHHPLEFERLMAQRRAERHPPVSHPHTRLAPTDSTRHVPVPHHPTGVEVRS